MSKTLLDELALWCERIAMSSLAAVAVVQLWQVFARYVFNRSPAWSEPLSVLLLCTLMSFAAAAAVHDGRHFRFSWLIDQLPKMRPIVNPAIDGLVGLSCLIIGLKAGFLAHDGLHIKQAGVALPIGSAYIPVSIAMCIASVFAFAQLMPKHASARRVPGSADAEHEGE